MPGSSLRSHISSLVFGDIAIAQYLLELYGDALFPQLHCLYINELAQTLTWTGGICA
jgi:glutathione S-transferase